jgi:HEAT repeat protein
LPNDSNAPVRASAAHTLGALRDASAKTSLQHAADSDADQFVRDQAAIALRRL